MVKVRACDFPSITDLKKWWKCKSFDLKKKEDKRATTNVQHRFVLFFYYLFFSFVPIELKPFVLKGKVLGNFLKNAKVWISVKNSETILPFSCCPFLVGERKITNKHKEFWRDTPWCASRLSRGHVPSVPWYVPSVPGTLCPFSIDLHINQAQMSQVSLGRPEFVPGTPPGHPTAKFLYLIFLYCFSLHN